jgi:membrane-associated phospholipid phosphatase
MERPFALYRYFLIMLVCYAAWVGLYFLTGWIGEVRGVVFDPASSVDTMFPYIPETVYVYLLAYVIVLGLFFIRRTPAFLNRAYLAFIFMNFTAFALFALVPAQGPERIITESDQGGIMALLYAVDARWCAFPSLHVANPWLIAFLSVRERRFAPISIVLLLVAIGISLSTLLVRQHYLLDIVGGFALAVMFFSIFHRMSVSESPW